MRAQRGEDRVLFLAWTRTVGRSREIAAALGGEAWTVYPERLADRRLVPLRYAYNLVRTVGVLLQRRPDVVIATNPPVFPGLVARAWCAVTGGRYVLDSHPSSFGAKNHKTSQRLLGVHRWLARRAACVMVTTSEWVDVLESWGARGVIVHEAPPLHEVHELTGPAAGRVLFPGVFGSDEPVDVLWELARRRPDLQFRVTGQVSRCPAHLAADVPPNITLLGYVDTPRFVAEAEAADAVLALSTEPTSVQRAGYEAVYWRRPLVVSDFPASRTAFPHSIHAHNDPASLSSALDEAMGPTWRDGALLDVAQKEQIRQWTLQLESLRSMISTPSSAPAVTR